MDPSVHEPRYATAPDGAPGYLPSLDGLRALGVSMVLGGHVGETFAGKSDSAVVRALVEIASIGPVGVDLFFVLSGFLITGILLASRGERGYFRSFYARRTLRIFPLYYTYLALLPVVLALIPAAQDALRSYARNWPWYALYLTNIKILFFYDDDIGSVQHLWSLAVEEQFYVVWALVVAALPRRGLATFVAAALALAPLLRGALLVRGADLVEIYMSSWTHADGLLVGAGIALARANAVHWRVVVKWAPAILGASVLGLLLLRRWLYDAAPQEHLSARVVHFSLLATLFGAVVVLCVRSDERGRTLPVLGSRALRRVGALSYGIYVYHFFLVRVLLGPLHELFGRGALGFAATMLSIALGSYAVAALSFRCIEGPALRLKRLFPRPGAGDVRNAIDVE